jgi:O-antigen/teichoic acid export membrane protein
VTRLREMAERHRALLTNAGSMIGATVVTSLLGVAFWFVAAQHFSQAAVGVAGAAVSAMLLLGFVASLGLGTLLMGELPRRVGSQRSLLNAALIVAAASGLALGLAFALIAPLISANLSPLDETGLAVVAFALATGLTALAYVLDQSLIGMLRGGLQLTRNVVFAAVKLGGLLVIAGLVADPGAAWIYTSWGAGIVISLIVLVRFHFARPAKEDLRPDFASLRTMRAAAASHAVVNLALESADLAMPIIVLSLLTPAQNAGFYIAWLVVGFLVMVPLSLSSVAYALDSGETVVAEVTDPVEGVVHAVEPGPPEEAGDRFRFTLAASFVFGVAATIVLIPGAELILRIFGSGYAETATTALRVMTLGVFPLIIKTHYIAIHRARRTLRRALPLAWAGTVLELGGGALGAALGGIDGVAWGWVAGLVVEAVVMAPDVFGDRLKLRRRTAGASNRAAP